MTPLEINRSEEVEPAWDSFGIKRTDFRPQFDGDLVNVFSTVQPQLSKEATETYTLECAKMLVEWILKNRDRFGKKDRFLIIIGWSKSIRETNRHIIKTGGTYMELQHILDGKIDIEFRRQWSNLIFDEAS
jgi:hypothetical protein